MGESATLWPPHIRRSSSVDVDLARALENEALNQKKAAEPLTIKQAGLRLEVAAAALNAAASGLSMGHIDNDAVDCGAMLSDLEDKRWQLDKARADFQRAIERATEIDAATLRRWMVL